MYGVHIAHKPPEESPVVQRTAERLKLGWALWGVGGSGRRGENMQQGLQELQGTGDGYRMSLGAGPPLAWGVQLDRVGADGRASGAAAAAACLLADADLLPLRWAPGWQRHRVPSRPHWNISRTPRAVAQVIRRMRAGGAARATTYDGAASAATADLGPPRWATGQVRPEDAPAHPS